MIRVEDVVDEMRRGSGIDVSFGDSTVSRMDTDSRNDEFMSDSLDTSSEKYSVEMADVAVRIVVEFWITEFSVGFP